MRKEPSQVGASVCDATHAMALFNSKICSMKYQQRDGVTPWSVSSYRDVSLPGIYICKAIGTGERIAYRTEQEIRADPVRDFVLTLPLDSQSFCLQAGKQTFCQPGKFRIHSMSRPFWGTCSGMNSSKSYTQLTVRVSGSLLRSEIPDIDALCNLSLEIRPGAGRIMNSMLELALAEGKGLSELQACDFSKSLVRSIASAVLESPELALGKLGQHQPSHARVVSAAQDFIAANLSDPGLDCAMVAAHCAVSTTYLHMAFAAHSMKVGTHIREARLKECRTALSNPALRHLPIA